MMYHAIDEATGQFLLSLYQCRYMAMVVSVDFIQFSAPSGGGESALVCHVTVPRES